MNTPSTPTRYHAVAMELAAYLDERYVEMHILTSTGKTIDIVCERDSILSVQRHIEQIGRACPEISTWKADDTRDKSNQAPYQAALWEGWPLSPHETYIATVIQSAAKITMH